MDSKVEMYVKRARTEIDSAEVLFEVSNKKELKDAFSLEEGSTFYSGTISHAYYAIFYCAKAMLFTKHIETESPNIHKATFEGFKREFIDTGIMDMRLLVIYTELIVRAEDLLDIYKEEKRKRGNFTYNTIPQANMSPAEQSMKNARTFYKHCTAFLFGKPERRAE